MQNFGYFTDLNEISSTNTWGVYMAASGTMEGQPFAWADYVCLGNAQIAFTEADGHRIALRVYLAGNWNNWKIITSA